VGGSRVGTLSGKPVIDTSTQQSTSGGAVEASTNAADTSPDPESSQQTLDKYDNNNN